MCCCVVIRSKPQFWGVRYTVRLRLSIPPNRLALSPPPYATSNVHPVNYFVSGYLQRAVNSCRADYTDRFIALVSQSNVRNAPPPATHIYPRPFSGLPEFPSSASPPTRAFHCDFGYHLARWIGFLYCRCSRQPEHSKFFRRIIRWMCSDNYE